MARRTQWLLFAVAILFAGIASLLVTTTLKKVERTSSANLETVVVATHHLAGHQIIGPGDVTTRQMDKSSVPAGAITTTSQVVGQYTSGDWFAGEPVMGSMVTASSNVAAFPLSIPSGYRAYTIPNDAVTGVDHLISTGDHVDVVVSYSPKSGPAPIVKIVLQDVQVLYVDNAPVAGTVDVASSSSLGGQSTASSSSSSKSSSGSSSSSSSSSSGSSSTASSGSSASGGGTGSPQSTRTQVADTVTLALTPEQTEQLDLARALGQIQLVLRNPNDTGNTTSTTLANLP